MRKWLLTVLCALLPGCSLAAALAGADANTVDAFAELDRIAVPIVAGAIAQAVIEAAEDGFDSRPPDADAYLCWINEAGGDEIIAASATEARVICQYRHGAQPDPQHCRCESLAAD